MEANLQNLFEAETHPFYTPTDTGWKTEWLFLWGIELLLIARLILQFFGVSSDGFFANLLYTSTDYLLLPFTWLFGFRIAESGILDWMTVLAISIYWLLSVGAMTFLSTGQSVSKIEIARALSKKKYGGYR